MKKLFLLYAFFFILIIANARFSQNVSGEHDGVVINNDTCIKIDKYLSQLVIEKNFSGGLLIIKDGKKILSKGYGWANKESGIAFTPSTLASMGSITKSFTASAIMKLFEQKKLDLKDNLKNFFPSVPPDKAGISIHQLLTHSSGFHELQNDGGDYEKIEKEEYLSRVFNVPLSFKPGEKAVYTNINMGILAIIIEQVSGMNYESFLKKYLFTPAGIKNIGYCYPAADNINIAHGYQNGKDWGTHPQHFAVAGGGPYWNLKGSGGLQASLNDMYLWAMGISKSILSKESIEKMFTPYIKEEETNGFYSFGYGCTISKSRRNTKAIDNGGSNGVYFARLIRLPEEGLIFYMVTNESSINANMVLPNVTQLYFNGTIAQDATVKQRFDSPLAEKIYTLLADEKLNDLGVALKKENIVVEDDMVLLEVGQKLIEEQKADKALLLYQLYTKTFPQIIVAWNDLGDVYLMKQNKEAAIKCYQQALKLRPDNARAKENLIRLAN